MRRFLLSLAIVIIASVNLFSYDFDMALSPGTTEVNRLEGFIQTYVSVSNYLPVKDIKFDVKLELIDCDGEVVPIPAKNVFPDGTKDESKWTEVIPKGNGIYEFHYYMADNAAHFLPANQQLRRIMEFYNLFTLPVPDCGKMKITFSNFRVIGVNSLGNAVNLTVPDFKTITVNFGDCPPEETILNLSADAYVNRTASINDLNLTMNYLSSKPFTELSFDLTAPTGWSQPNYNFVRDPGTVTFTNIASNKWRVKVTGNLPFSVTYSKWLNFKWSFPANATGNAQFIMNNFAAKDINGKKLVATKEIIINVDLGEPVDGLKNVKYTLSKRTGEWLSLTNYPTNKFGDMLLSLNIDNIDKNVKTTSFTLEIPNYFSLLKILTTLDGTGDEAQIKQVGSNPGTKIYQIDMIADLNTYWGPANGMRELGVLVLSFTDLPAGPAKFIIDDIMALQTDGQQINATKRYELTIDFLPEFWRFKKGDSDYNFGNGYVEYYDDVTRLEDYLNGLYPNPSLYQLWAFDFNGDGVIDWKDLRDLKDYINGTSVNDNISSTEVYPNPSSGQITFNLTTANLLNNTLLIYNQLGELVYQANVTPGQNLINLDLPSGAYYLQTNQTTSTLIIQK